MPNIISNGKTLTSSLKFKESTRMLLILITIQHCLGDSKLIKKTQKEGKELTNIRKDIYFFVTSRHICTATQTEHSNKICETY